MKSISNKLSLQRGWALTRQILHARQRGFTIIEVVLVLAIAGLIFLIVFLAVPTLQRSRRDTQRRSDLGRMGSLLEGIASNGSGDYPATILDANNMSNPSDGVRYTVTTVVPAAGSYPVGGFVYDQGGTCNADGSLTAGTGTRKYALSIGLEAGGQTCVSSGS
jgi:prepilin-type N-terminal cleavage/methylation domain-containing protein